jgi:hypothetical protein
MKHTKQSKSDVIKFIFLSLLLLLLSSLSLSSFVIQLAFVKLLRKALLTLLSLSFSIFTKHFFLRDRDSLFFVSITN